MAVQPVFLNVYDLHHFNKWAYYLGLGAHHAGVQVGGLEWSFGYLPTDDTGVFSVEPQTAPGAVFRMSLLMGYTQLSPSQVDDTIASLARVYTGRSYHMLTRNCCDFSDELCFALVGRRIPGWVSRLPRVASKVDCVLPPALKGPFPPEAEEQTPILAPPVPFEPFSGKGHVLGGGSLETESGDGSSSRTSGGGAIWF